MSDPQNVMIVPLPKQEAPAQPATAPAPAPVSNAVPYDRFHEVVEEKNSLKAEVENMKRMMAGIQSAVSPTPQGPSINTIEDLVKYTETVAEKKANEIAEKYNQQYIMPLHQERMLGNYQSAVENYFQNDPEAASVRQEMDAFTATLPPQDKQAVIQSIMSGNKLTLDGIKFHVLTQKQKQIQEGVGKSVFEQANQATQPQPFRTIKVEANNANEAFNLAKEGKGSWTDFFEKLGPIPKKD